MNVPNAITALRLALVPVFAWLLLDGQPVAAAIVFVAAAASDGLDGVAARLLDQETPLGAILDPLADKLLGLVALSLLVAAGALPAWLLALSLARDAIVIAAGIASKLRRRSVSASPTRISKYATFSLMTTVALALLVGTEHGGQGLASFTAVAAVVAGECLLVACAQYGWLLRSLLRAPAPAAPA